MQSLKSSNIKVRTNSFAWSETHQLLPSIQAKVMKRQAVVHFSTLLLPWSLKHNRDYCHSKFESSWLHILWWQKKERQCISFWLCMDSVPGIYITMDFNGFSSCRQKFFKEPLQNWPGMFPGCVCRHHWGPSTLSSKHLLLQHLKFKTLRSGTINSNSIEDLFKW